MFHKAKMNFCSQKVFVQQKATVLKKSFAQQKTTVFKKTLPLL